MKKAEVEEVEEVVVEEVVVEEAWQGKCVWKRAI